MPRSTPRPRSVGLMLSGCLTAAAAMACVAERSAAADGPLPIGVRASMYASLKDVLAPGDALFASAARGPTAEGARHLREAVQGRKPDQLTPEERRKLREWGQEHPWQFDEGRLQAALASLREPSGDRFKKVLVFSAYADLEKYIDRVPKDIAVLAFNTETGMTPASENEDIAANVAKFGKLAHAKGFKASWGPSLDYYERLEGKGKLRAALEHVDQAALQLQRVLQQGDAASMKAFAAAKVRLIHHYRPDAKIVAQLVLGRQSPEQTIAGFRALEGLVDECVIFTTADDVGTKQVILGLRGK